MRCAWWTWNCSLASRKHLSFMKYSGQFSSCTTHLSTSRLFFGILSLLLLFLFFRSFHYYIVYSCFRSFSLYAVLCCFRFSLALYLRFLCALWFGRIWFLCLAHSVSAASHRCWDFSHLLTLYASFLFFLRIVTMWYILFLLWPALIV